MVLGKELTISHRPVELLSQHIRDHTELIYGDDESGMVLHVCRSEDYGQFTNTEIPPNGYVLHISWSEIQKYGLKPHQVNFKFRQAAIFITPIEREVILNFFQTSPHHEGPITPSERILVARLNQLCRHHKVPLQFSYHVESQTFCKPVDMWELQPGRYETRVGHVTISREENGYTFQFGAEQQIHLTREDDVLLLRDICIRGGVLPFIEVGTQPYAMRVRDNFKSWRRRINEELTNAAIPIQVGVYKSLAIGLVTIDEDTGNSTSLIPAIAQRSADGLSTSMANRPVHWEHCMIRGERVSFALVYTPLPDGRTIHTGLILRHSELHVIYLTEEEQIATYREIAANEGFIDKQRWGLDSNIHDRMRSLNEAALLWTGTELMTGQFARGRGYSILNGTELRPRFVNRALQAIIGEGGIPLNPLFQFYVRDGNNGLRGIHQTMVVQKSIAPFELPFNPIPNFAGVIGLQTQTNVIWIELSRKELALIEETFLARQQDGAIPLETHPPYGRGNSARNLFRRVLERIYEQANATSIHIEQEGKSTRSSLRLPILAE